MEVEKWRETVNQASPAFCHLAADAGAERSSAEGAGEASVARATENPVTD